MIDERYQPRELDPTEIELLQQAETYLSNSQQYGGRKYRPIRFPTSPSRWKNTDWTTVGYRKKISAPEPEKFNERHPALSEVKQLEHRGLIRIAGSEVSFGNRSVIGDSVELHEFVNAELHGINLKPVGQRKLYRLRQFSQEYVSPGDPLKRVIIFSNEEGILADIPYEPYTDHQKSSEPTAEFASNLLDGTEPKPLTPHWLGY